MSCEEAPVFAVSMMSIVRVFVARRIAKTRLTTTNRIAKFAICLFELTIDFMTFCLSLMEVEASLVRTHT